ncbi:RluA family pseudouridine synthase [Candidatus Gracilibacteria bacterium]|nr:RluA family pseudouridine synthase [Candidatus Gracilibacteria bacterium]
MKLEFCVYIFDKEIRRVDMYLSALFKEQSRSYIQKLIEKGNVTVNGKIVSKHEKLKKGDLVEMIFETEKMEIEAENMALDIVYENEDFAIINKDAGINTHPVPGEGGKSGTLVNALLHHFDGLSVINGVERPGIVHRLDKDTSGLIIIAKNDKTMRALQIKMNKRTIKKTYLALVDGIIKESGGYIESYIGRDPQDRKKMTVKNPINPKLAKTKFSVIKYVENKYTLAEVDLLTGRTHQIRVHFASIGHPIVGDKTYGNEKTNKYFKEIYGLGRQFLHSYKLSFNLDGIDYNFEAPLKNDIKKIIN